jgi:hypothetical protein
MTIKASRHTKSTTNRLPTKFSIADVTVPWWFVSTVTRARLQKLQAHVTEHQGNHVGTRSVASDRDPLGTTTQLAGVFGTTESEATRVYAKLRDHESALSANYHTASQLAETERRRILDFMSMFVVAKPMAAQFDRRFPVNTPGTDDRLRLRDPGLRFLSRRAACEFETSVADVQKFEILRHPDIDTIYVVAPTSLRARMLYRALVLTGTNAPLTNAIKLSCWSDFHVVAIVGFGQDDEDDERLFGDLYEEGKTRVLDGTQTGWTRPAPAASSESKETSEKEEEGPPGGSLFRAFFGHAGLCDNQESVIVDLPREARFGKQPLRIPCRAVAVVTEKTMIEIQNLSKKTKNTQVKSDAD